MKATDAPQCTICPAKHRPGTPHDTKGVVPRPGVRAMFAPRPEIRNAEPEIRNARKTIRNAPGLSCEVCGKAIEKPSRGRAPRFCGTKCRVRAARSK